ncbi:hypothetical protein N7449_010481 [Penicillium cf. viridicatum]|uniref:Uncharacterized protein n=1 Tax=Penicillium cf. viridicatum TaxID=2972119 RepID=A0A9W9J0D6_9EURO|nr:hypothetical protein N7449_010481 [Penicillium cf. viridicatum]
MVREILAIVPVRLSVLDGVEWSDCHVKMSDEGTAGYIMHAFFSFTKRTSRIFNVIGTQTSRDYGFRISATRQAHKGTLSSTLKCNR